MRPRAGSSRAAHEPIETVAEEAVLRWPASATRGRAAVSTLASSKELTKKSDREMRDTSEPGASSPCLTPSFITSSVRVSGICEIAIDARQQRRGDERRALEKIET